VHNRQSKAAPGELRRKKWIENLCLCVPADLRGTWAKHVWAGGPEPSRQWDAGAAQHLDIEEGGLADGSRGRPAASHGEWVSNPPGNHEPGSKCVRRTRRETRDDPYRDDYGDSDGSGGPHVDQRHDREELR